MRKTEIDASTVQQFDKLLKECGRLYGGIIAMRLIYRNRRYDQYWSVEDFHRDFEVEKYSDVVKILISIPRNEKKVGCLAIDTHLKEMCIYDEEDYEQTKREREANRVRYDYSIGDDFTFDEGYDYFKVDDEFVVRYRKGTYEFYGNGKWIERPSLINYSDGVNHDTVLLKRAEKK